MKLILQDSINRAEFYSKNLGCFGTPLSDTLSPPKGLTLVSFQGKLYPLGSGAHKEVSEEEYDPFDTGFSTARCWAEGCLGWIWCQWLSQSLTAAIQRDVEFVVDRGMEVQDQCPNQRYRCLHDLWLLHCAILGARSDKLRELAKRVVDSKGDTSPRSKDRSPPNNNGELFTAAWCGMLKYWILGDLEKAVQESEIIWGAYRYDIARVAPKALVAKWLEGDWKGFVKLQQRDFKALWDWARKNRILVSESDSEKVIAFDRLPVPGRGWCWAHCGLAMLAHRHGVEVATDLFWFPPHALQGLVHGTERMIDGPTSALHRMAAPPRSLAIRESRRGRHR
ncbi:MAG: hypothetical protein NTW03_03630 [Verrucomicrobia bacterium]|nr:hypothetical protein [Verrucomicrobiota bacterium]